MQDTLPTFGEFLQSVIAEKHLTQREVSYAVQISEKTLSAYIKGERMPPLDVAYRLSKHLNFSLDALLCPDDLANVSLTPDEELVNRIKDYCMQGGSLYAVNKFTPLFVAVLEQVHYLTRPEMHRYKADTDAHRMVLRNTEIFGHVLAILKCLMSMIEMDNGTQWEKELEEQRKVKDDSSLLDGLMNEMLGGIKK